MSGSFVQLAKEYNPRKNKLAGMFVSEKLDGMRALWDGGATKGLLKGDVPWANKTNPEHVSTGLWSRYGNVIHCPEWWSKVLPPWILDGELYNPVIPRQELMSVVKKYEAGPEWKDVKYYIFDRPSMSSLFYDRYVSIPNCNMNMNGAYWWMRERGIVEDIGQIAYKRVWKTLVDSGLTLVDQTQLPHTTDKANEAVDFMLERVMANGGEGLMVRDPNAFYIPRRVDTIAKLKPRSDAEGTVVGYIGGKGKLEGMFGALVLDYKGKRLELSGFTDAERQVTETLRPGVEVRDRSLSTLFPLGAIVTFKYRGETKDGIPQEAAYWRRET